MSSPTDWELIQEIRSGNAQSFRILIKNHEKQAMTLAIRLLKRPQEAEEVVQDAFLKAFRNLSQFRGDAKFGTWLYRIVYNLCLTRLQRRKPDQTSDSIDRMHGEASLLASNDPSVLDRLETGEMNAMVASGIAKLPENMKAAVTLFYLQEMKYEEIAEVMGVPEGTVKTYLFRGRNKLREILLQNFSEDVNEQKHFSFG